MVGIKSYVVRTHFKNNACRIEHVDYSRYDSEGRIAAETRRVVEYDENVNVIRDQVIVTEYDCLRNLPGVAKILKRNSSVTSFIFLVRDPDNAIYSCELTNVVVALVANDGTLGPVIGTTDGATVISKSP